MAQNLQTNIVINAKTGNGFSEVGNTLSELSSLVNGISQELINFGQDSANVYREYEKSMTDAEVALSTIYGRGTRELGNVMTDLDVAATEWAATTIFHTDDVANAISEAAHAGWDYDKIMSGIPAAMQLAQAGSIDLSEAVNYIVKATNAAGISFDETTDFIDHWTFAANSSATTVDEMGAAMLRMGRTMKFAGGYDEVLVMLAELAKAGTTGSDAGTLLRNSMLRLVAPTDKAKEAMASLGAEGEEIESILNDEAVAAANAQLATAGFSAYDESGNLKPMLEVYTDLYQALGNIAGGYEDLEHNEDAMSILSAIFPTRSITGALALLEAAGEEYHGLYDYLQNGDAEGYGKYASETMMDTLYGSMETFESKVERLKQLVGSELADELESGLSGLGGFIDSIAEMDSGNLGALVSGLEEIAIAGPFLAIASGAFRMIGSLLTPAGAIGMGVITLAALVKTLHELETVNLENQFGLGSLDHAAITKHLKSLANDFNGAYEKVDAFRQAVDDSITSYNTASQTFTGDLFTKMLTQDELSEEDKIKLQDLAHTMENTVLDALANDTEATRNFWDVFFGDTSDNPDQAAAYESIISGENTSYQRAVAEAEGIGEGLRQAMNAAFADGHISEEEYQNILSYVESYNEAIARANQEAKSREDRIAAQELMHRAQHASLDELSEMGKEIRDARDQVVQDATDEFYHEISKIEIDAEDTEAFYRGIIESTDNPYIRDALNSEISQLQQRTESAVAVAEEEHKKQMTELAESYDEMIFSMWDSEIQQSGLSEPYEYLKNFAEQTIMGGTTPEAAAQAFMDVAKRNGWNQEQLTNVLSRWIDETGGIDEVASLINNNVEIGNASGARRYMLALAMQQIAGGLQGWTVEDYDDSILKFLFGDNWMENTGFTGLQFQDAIDAYTGGNVDLEAWKEGVETLRNNTNANVFLKTLEDIASYDESQLSAFQTTYQADLKNAVDAMPSGYMNQLQETANALSEQYDFKKIIDDSNVGFAPGLIQGYKDIYAAYQLLYGGINAEDYRIQVTPEFDLEALAGIDPIPVSTVPEDGLEEIDITLNPDTSELEAAMEIEDGQSVTIVADPETGELHAAIMDEDGDIVSVIALGNIDDLVTKINSQDGRHITVYADTVSSGTAYAAGGRATEASIFGEAGPEWAIPEEHSERTAQLLDAARAASGFTWGEILNRFGGLNANPQNTPTTIVYSPVIHAADASGVEQALREDKQRLEKWFEEKKMRDAMEVYA